MSLPSATEASKALKHPLRRQLIPIFAANEPLSPREAAQLVREPLTLVSYHVKELVKLKFLVLSSREQVRGVLKNYYVLNENVLDLPKVQRLIVRQNLSS